MELSLTLVARIRDADRLKITRLGILYAYLKQRGFRLDPFIGSSGMANSLEPRASGAIMFIYMSKLLSLLLSLSFALLLLLLLSIVGWAGSPYLFRDSSRIWPLIHAHCAPTSTATRRHLFCLLLFCIVRQSVAWLNVKSGPLSMLSA